MESKKKRVSIIGRVITGLSVFSALTVMLMQRINLNVVVPQIVTIRDDIANKILWTSNQQSLVLMSFYIGFFMNQIIVGFVVEKFGSKVPLALGMIISSISCIVSGLIFDKSTDVLIFLRVLMGVAQAVYFPVVIVSLTNWVQPSFRGTAVGLVFPGTQCGTILGLIITSYFARDESQWRVTFYLFGGLGFIWLIFWCIFYTDDPQKNRWITKAEKDLLNRKVERSSKTNIKTFPISKIFTSAPVIAVITTHFASFWSLSLIFTIIPSFMSDLYFIPVKDQAYISFLSPAFTWIGGVTSSIISDFLLRKKIFSRLTVRKLLNFGATIPTGLFFMSATFISPEKHDWGIFIIVISSYLSGFQFSVIMPNIIDIAPQFCGIIGAISDTFAALAGIIAIQITYSFVSERHLVRDWQIPFGIMLIIQTIALIVFTLFAKTEVQPWASPNSQPEPVEI